MFADIGVGFWVRAGKTMPTTRTFVPTLHLKVCLLECRASLGCMYGIEAIVRSRRRHSQEPMELVGGLQVCTFAHSHYLTEIKSCKLLFLKRTSAGTEPGNVKTRVIVATRRRGRESFGSISISEICSLPSSTFPILPRY